MIGKSLVKDTFQLKRRLPSASQKICGDPRVYLARTEAACPIVVLFCHTGVGVIQYGAGEVRSAPSVRCRGRSCSRTEQVG